MHMVAIYNRFLYSKPVISSAIRSKQKATHFCMCLFNLLVLTLLCIVFYRVATRTRSGHVIIVRPNVWDLVMLTTEPQNVNITADLGTTPHLMMTGTMVRPDTLVNCVWFKITLAIHLFSFLEPDRMFYFISDNPLYTF